MSRKLLLISLAALLLLPAMASAGSPGLRAHVETLTQRDMEGRYPGTEGAKRAATYIEQQMKRANLKPAGEGEGFEVVADLVTRVDIDALLVIGEHVAAPDAEFVVAGFSGDAKLKASPIFCGFGLSEPGEGWDDYQGTDVSGRIVVVATGVPDKLRDHEHASRLAKPTAKAATALAKGAAAVVIVNNPSDFGDSEGQLPDGTPRVAPKAALDGIAVLRVTHRAFQKGATAFNLVETLAQLNADGAATPAELPFPIQLGVRVDREHAAAPSLLGRIDGKDKTLPPVVLGAHYDGLGSLVTEDGQRSHYEGADDNASGIAVLLKTAAELSKTSPNRTIIFAAISGEELGLKGSRRVARFIREKFGANIYINMDMVGRLDERGLRSYGLDTFAQSDAVLSLAKSNKLDLLGLPVYDSDSDHISFLETGFSVIGFSTGRHSGYHSVYDRIDGLNWKSMQRIQNFVKAVVVGFAN